MNKRKLSALIASLSLVAVIGIGATLAYFTDNASTENVVTMGKVDIKLTENKVKKDEEIGKWVQTGTDDVTEDGLQFTDVYPGETVPKNPTVTVGSESADAYIRIKMDIMADAGSGISQDDLKVLREQLEAQIDANWNYSDGYYYYKEIRKADDAVVLFDTVTIPSQWKNNTAGQSFSIKLQAEAIQAANFEPVRDEAGNITGWGNVEIE